jgi:hypothetical protein
MVCNICEQMLVHFRLLHISFWHVTDLIEPHGFHLR